jgi:hypothetical protein
MVVVEDLTASQKDKNRTREDSYSFRHSIKLKTSTWGKHHEKRENISLHPHKTLKVFSGSAQTKMEVSS